MDNIYSIVQSGEASRNDLEDASSSNVLWCSVVLLLKPNIYFAGTEDISTVTSNLPVHVQRLLGALFSTFEVLMDHQRTNHAYLVASIVQCVGQDAYNVQNLVVQMTKDYKSMFSYAYMFNRRTGAHPVSQVQQVSDYFELAQQQQRLATDDSIISDRVVNLDEDDDNDSYERLMRSNTSSHFNAPKFGAPIVMPLRPVKLLSDDEHYGSDYQPAIASDLETDLTYDSQRRQDVNQHGQLQDDSIFSMDGGSILNSYYKYNGWNNAVEEDEDSDTDYYAPPVVEPVRPKRMTRMRQLATSRSTDNVDAERDNKAPGIRTKKKGKKLRSKKTTTSLSDQGNTGGEKMRTQDTKPKLPWASMGNKGLLSDESDDSNDDEGSDFSENETLPLQAQQQKLNYHSTPAVAAGADRSPSSRFVSQHQQQHTVPRAMQKHSDEVEDFETEEEDAEFPTKNAHQVHNSSSTAQRLNVAGSVPSAHYGRRQEPDAYSPGGTSGNSSFELSDREKRHHTESKHRHQNESIPASRAEPTSNRDWRTADQRTAVSQPHKSGNAGRMRSVLSDDESESEEVVTSVRALRVPPAGAKETASVRNPLDSSIEVAGFGRFSDKSDRAFGKNPLDQSIEITRRGSNDSERREDDWSKRVNTSANARDTGRVNADRAAPIAQQNVPPSNRSVVRLPTTQPSKPAAKNTEGPGVDLVEDWDSQLSDEEESAAPVKSAARSSSTASSSSAAAGWGSSESKPSARPVAVAVVQPKLTHSSVAAPQPDRYGRTHEHKEEPHHKLSPDLAVIPPLVPVRDTHQRETGSPEKGTSDDRKAGLERMRENILKCKREKERAGGRYADSPVEIVPTLVESRRMAYHSEITPRFIDPSQPVSVLRKSVTFSDQQNHTAAPVVPISASGGKPNVAVVKVNGRYVIEDSAEVHAAPEAPQAPHLNAHHHDSHRRAVSPPHHLIAPSVQGEALHVPHVTHAPAPVVPKGISLELPPPSRVAPKQEQLSPKLPPTRAPAVPTTTQASVPVPTRNSSPALPATTVRAPSPLAPTLSRVPSEQLLPTRAPTHPMSQSRNESTRDMNMGISGSRQFSSSNLSVNSSISRPVLAMPEIFAPPPLSEFALNSGIILEGYLHKKSGTFGLWQKV